MFVNRIIELEKEFPGISQVYLIICVAEMNNASCKMQSFGKRLNLPEDKIKEYLVKLVKEKHIFYFKKGFVSENSHAGKGIKRLFEILQKYKFSIKEICELYDNIYWSKNEDEEFVFLERLIKSIDVLSFNQAKTIFIFAHEDGFKNVHYENIRNILEHCDKKPEEEIKSKNVQFCTLLLNNIKSKKIYKKSNGKYDRECVMELHKELSNTYGSFIHFNIIEKFLNKEGVELDG